MTVRRWMAAIGIVAGLLWLVVTLDRTGSPGPHLRPDPALPGAFDTDRSYCPRRPFWPKFWRMLIGRPWPGDYRCPDHPHDVYFEDPAEH